MPTIQQATSDSLRHMNAGSTVFDKIVTPAIAEIVKRTPPEHRQAWWDGFLASLVGAMSVTLGEKATQEVCEDLFTRAADHAADVERARKKPQ